MKLKCPILQPSNKDISFTSTIENPIFILFLKVLKKKKLSVVIILSKDQSQKSYVFKLNFSKENGGLYE